MRQRLTNFARALRRQETTAEQRLWRELRNRQVDGWKFKRQAPHGRYVLDFFCADAALVIEVDGFQHMDARAIQDAERTTYLELEGLRVLRLTNTDVLDNMDGALESIYLALGQRSSPSPGAVRRPLPKGRGYGVPRGKADKNK
jgi:very-short-patch-repair endonuclease